MTILQGDFGLGGGDGLGGGKEVAPYTYTYILLIRIFLHYAHHKNYYIIYTTRITHIHITRTIHYTHYTLHTQPVRITHFFKNRILE